jgi:YhcN/YlaJ family sporulation lipoprotein
MWKFTVKLFLATVIWFCLAGCNDDNEGQPQNTNNLIKVTDSEIDGTKKELSNTEMAKRMAHLANSIPGVYSASAIVVGPYAVVGIDVNKDLDRTRVGTIKYSVAEALKEEMGHNNNVAVIADGDVTERIRHLYEKVRQGHPEDAIVDELASLVGRYMPEVPQKENQPVEPDTNQQMLDEKKKNQLENTRNKQSNNNMK